jgi:hypothetical protein
MAMDIKEFHQDFFQTVLGTADADGQYVEDAFFDQVCEKLIESGELDTADRAHYIAARGMRIDGYGGDPIDTDSVLNLIIADFQQSSDIETLAAKEMDSIFNRALNFLKKSLDPSFRNGLEETTPAFGLADLIESRWRSLAKVRIFLISNRVLSSRVDGREAGEFDDIPITYNVWDLGRLHRYVTSGQALEKIDINLEKDFGQSLAALPAYLGDANYQSYLIAIPGTQLAQIYDRWGARLLEQNVRVFLQARGNVNRGIRNTIENDPDMFFAYNNGVTATAEGVKTKKSETGQLITHIKNLQIVNGGQTTASIHAASRKKEIDLSGVFVQMKLSIIDSEEAMEVVPKISEFANSQNRVNAADFFANHPYHVRLEGFSRRMHAPSPDGIYRESKWFYERARGQYQDARSKLSASLRKRFDLEYPKRQVFTKTDLAKFINVWEGMPDIVSKGAQKNFAEFAKIIGGEWTKKEDFFNEMYYQHVIAKAIIFKEVETLVSDQPWYEGGYRANIVAYAIAKLGHDVGGLIDFDRVWRGQTLPPILHQALVVVAKAVHDVIVAPAPGIKNVTEWAKQQACWHRVKELKVEWPRGLRSGLVSKEEKKEEEKFAVKEQKMLNGIEAQAAVVQAGGAFWKEVKGWGDNKKLLSIKEASILSVAASIPAKLPSEKQCIAAIETLLKLNEEGCPIELKEAVL